MSHCCPDMMMLAALSSKNVEMLGLQIDLTEQGHCSSTSSHGALLNLRYVLDTMAIYNLVEVTLSKKAISRSSVPEFSGCEGD